MTIRLHGIRTWHNTSSIQSCLVVNSFLLLGVKRVSVESVNPTQRNVSMMPKADTGRWRNLSFSSGLITARPVKPLL